MKSPLYDENGIRTSYIKGCPCTACERSREAGYLVEPKDFKLAAPAILRGGSSSYYDLPRDCKTLQDIIVSKEMDYTRGNIFKAAFRWGAKGVSDDHRENMIYNLEKIKWFADDLLERLYSQDPNNPRGQGDGEK